MKEFDADSHYCPDHGYAGYSPVQPVSSVSLPIDPKENQGKVAINILDRTADEATINTSEVVLELLLETFLTTGLLCFLVLKLD